MVVRLKNTDREKGLKRPWSMRKQLSIKEQLTSITVCSKHTLLDTNKG